MMTAPVSDKTNLAPPATSCPAVPAAKRRRSFVVWCSYVWVGLVVLLAAAAPWLSIAPYDAAVAAPRETPRLGSLDLLLGTDSIGRSMLSRTIHGARVSLVVGTVAGLSGFSIGTILGMLGGYYGGWIDKLVTLVADMLLAFPALILLLSLAAVFSPSVSTILVGLALVTIPTFTRLARANAIAWSNREFVRAAMNMGAGSARILAREILPNVIPALAAYLPLVIAALIVAEGSLSFLGLSIPPPTPSWGAMINGGREALDTSPHIVLVPSTAIFLTVFALNQVAEHMRHRFDRTLDN